MRWLAEAIMRDQPGRPRVLTFVTGADQTAPEFKRSSEHE